MPGPNESCCCSTRRTALMRHGDGRRSLIGTTAGALAVALWVVPRADAADRPAVALLDVRLSEGNAEAQHRVETAVAAGIRASGGAAISTEDLLDRLGTSGADCALSSACLVDIGRRTGAPLILRGTVETQASSYLVSLVMLSANTQRVLATKADRCDGCTPDEAYESVGLTASALLTESMRYAARATNPPVAEAPAAAVPRAAAQPNATGASRVAPARAVPPADRDQATNPSTTPLPRGRSASAEHGLAAPDTPHRTMRAVWWTAVATGSVTAAVAVWLWTLDGDCSSDSPGQGAPCPTLWDTHPQSALLLAGGTGLALAGVIGLLAGRPSMPSTARLLVGPGSIHLAARF